MSAGERAVISAVCVAIATWLFCMLVALLHRTKLHGMSYDQVVSHDLVPFCCFTVLFAVMAAAISIRISNFDNGRWNDLLTVKSINEPADR
jgi:hypothetical protein